MASFTKEGKSISPETVRILEDFILRDEALDRSKEALRSAVRIQLQSLSFLCPHCKETSQIGDMTFIQYRRTVHRRSSADEVHLEPELCDVLCPQCTKRIRLYSHPRRDDVLACIEALRPFGVSELFPKIEEGKSRE